MTAKHRDPEFLRNARLVRAQVRRAWRLGDEVRCWRCGRMLEPGAPFDVGHLDPHGGPARSNLAPECVRCNRGEGGRRGAAITNGRRPRPSLRPVRRGGVGLAPW
ncbi:hypothetical protein [Microbacterium sp.]|uniref:hypothetical protein n=1 Tax=Microbacterium sp. TaxID=51671 RepID=UPI002812071B|nr:hypothetical protein [Microbacterium sp.]